MRVGLLHLGQSVDFVVSITFLRSPVFAIFAMPGVVLLLEVSLLTQARLPAASTARYYDPLDLLTQLQHDHDSLISVYMKLIVLLNLVRLA